MTVIKTQGASLGANPLSIIPRELQLHIMSFLDERSKCVLAYVCKVFYRLSQDNSIWLASLSERRIAVVKLEPNQARRIIVNELRFYCSVFSKIPNFKITSKNLFDAEQEVKAYLKSNPQSAQGLLHANLLEMSMDTRGYDGRDRPLDKKLQVLITSTPNFPPNIMRRDESSHYTMIYPLKCALEYGCDFKTVSMIVERTLEIHTGYIVMAMENKHPEETILSVLDHLQASSRVSLEVFLCAINRNMSESVLFKMVEKLRDDVNFAESIKTLIPEKVYQALKDRNKIINNPTR